jgi:predicted membrane protein
VIDSRAEAERGIRIGAGEAVVDLSDVPLTAETLVVPISLGTGDFTIVLPEGVEASGSVSIGAGQVRWNVGDDDETWSGILIDKQNFGVPADEAQLRIQVGVGAGNVTIEEE